MLENNDNLFVIRLGGMAQWKGNRDDGPNHWDPLVEHRTPGGRECLIKQPGFSNQQ